MRHRISNTSSNVLSPGAIGSHSSWQISMHRSGGNNQVVIRKLVVVQLNRRCARSSPGLRPAAPRYFHACAGCPNGSGDFLLRNPGGRHLIKQRLKGVVILAIQHLISTGSLASDSAAFRPPNPAPIMTICGRAFAFMAVTSCDAGERQSAAISRYGSDRERYWLCVG